MTHQSQTKSASSPSPVGRSGLLQRKCACGGTPGPTGECAACRKKRLSGAGVQTKLAVSTPGDRHEREADRLAERMVRGGVADGPLPVTPVRGTVGQRFGGPSAEPSGGASGQAARAVAGGGRPLSSAERGYFEPRLGHDLSAVRIHSDACAGVAAQGIQARAFTLGSHVAFAPGQYRPGSESGRRLLAHELVHTVQQSRTATGVGSSMLQRTMICSKRLQAPVIGLFFNHAYIDDTGLDDCRGARLPGNYAIQTLVSGNFLRGCAAKTDRSDDPQSYTPNVKPCRPKAGVTDVSKCLRNAFNAYADPSVYRNPRGPNSNTFAFTLANACCADSSSRGLGRVPGWGKPPASPCASGTLLAEGSPTERDAEAGSALI